MILPDTTVWIEFFRGHEPFSTDLAKLLEDGQVVAVAWVFGEILQGTRDEMERATVLSYWENLPRAPADSEDAWIQAGILSAEKKLASRGVGLIDAAIWVAARESGARVWTLDKKLERALPLELRFGK